MAANTHRGVSTFDVFFSFVFFVLFFFLLVIKAAKSQLNSGKIFTHKLEEEGSEIGILFHISDALNLIPSFLSSLTGNSRHF